MGLMFFPDEHFHSIGCKNFLMPIEDLFSISGRGTVVTGCIESGFICVGDSLEMVGFNAASIKVRCAGIETIRKMVDRAEQGLNVGVFLKGVEKKDIRRGMVLTSPRFVCAYKRFKAEIYILRTDEGGRTMPLYDRCRLNFYIRTVELSGEVLFPYGVKQIKPGNSLAVNINLGLPIALNIGLRFAIRENNKTIGIGQVVEIYY